MVKINMKTSEVFISEIEGLVKTKGYDSYIEAVVDYCNTHNMDVETAASLLKNAHKIKSKIQKEAEDIRMLPKTNRID